MGDRSPWKSSQFEKKRDVIYRAALSYPVWYILAWDHLREDVRTFRCDRIERARTTGQEFRLRSKGEFENAIKGIDAIQP